MKSGSGYTPANQCPNNLRKYRELKGLTISGLAEILGTDKSTVSQYETGSMEIKERRRVQLGHIFGLPADDFLPKGAVNEGNYPEPLFEVGTADDSERKHLRDHFAGEALPGLSDCATRRELRARGFNVARNIAVWAYEIADAMLAERAKGSNVSSDPFNGQIVEQKGN